MPCAPLMCSTSRSWWNGLLGKIDWSLASSDLRKQVRFSGSCLKARPASPNQFISFRFPRTTNCRCNLLYFADSDNANIRSLISNLGSAGVLTIGESDSFFRDGGMIGLVKVGEQIRMRMNLEPARRAGVKISPKLVRLAESCRSHEFCRAVGTQDCPAARTGIPAARRRYVLARNREAQGADCPQRFGPPSRMYRRTPTSSSGRDHRRPAVEVRARG